MRHLVILLLICIPLNAQAGKRGVTPEDYYAFKNVTDAQISPDGKTVAYAVTSADEKHNRRETAIWLTSLDGSITAQKLPAGGTAKSPRWSPDGKIIAFIEARPATGGSAAHADKPQVQLLTLSGGETRRVTDLANGVDAFQWSPDGSRLVCVSKTGPVRRPFDQGGSDVRHYTSATYKFNDTGFYDDRRTHLYVVDLASGKAAQITSGDQRNDTEPQWSPDGTQIAFSSEDTDKPLMANNDVWIVPAGGGELARVNRIQGNIHFPRWSPDGREIAYVASHTAEEQVKLMIAPVAGGPSRTIAADLDRAPAELNWQSPDALYFEAQSNGETHIFRANPKTGKCQPVTFGRRAVHHAAWNTKAGVMIYTVNDFTHLDDLYAADLSGRNEKQLTDVNREILSQLDVQKVERLSYKSLDGQPIDGFFVKPNGWTPGKKYPMVLVIHGGPASMFGFDWFHEFQVYSARGWAVLFTNPRGSGGYGEKFQRAVDHNWGGKAYDDIMAGVDAALSKYGWVDRDRLGVTGGSYGGFMTNWIVSHTMRFKAAVTLRSISNFTSVEGTRDAAYSHAADFGGDLFENFDFYWNSSPLKYASRVKTPTLVLHSDSDQRVPLEQGEQWFRALKHFGVTTEFVIFPRENHNLTRNGEPRHLVESLNWQLYWFERFLDGNTAAVRPTER
jgi:dipeptidyl aminopeptidase/acylaminoacyl peptidase